MPAIKGRIGITYDVWCGMCGCWETVPEVSGRLSAAAKARKMGRRLSRVAGWICPMCQERSPKPEAA